MQNDTIYSIAALILYSLVLIYSIVTSNKENTFSIESYARGKGKYSFLFIAVVMAVTMVGPADALALSQNGLKYGMIWCVFPIGAALAQLVTGLFFANKIKSSFGEINSIGDIYIKKCDKSSSIASGLIAFIQSIAFSGVLILAGGQVLATFMGVDKTLGMVLTALIVGGYTAYRGMVAVMKTDIFQGILMGLMIIAVLIGSIYGIIKSDINFNAIVSTSNFHNDYNVSLMLTMFLGYFLGELLLPTYVMRASVSENSNSASRGFIIASLILILWYILITFAGSLGNFILPESQKTEDLIIISVLRHYMTEYSTMYYIVGAFSFLVFISLIHSTFDSFLNNGAVSFSRDVIGRLVKLKPKQELWLSQQTTIAISFLGLFIAIWKNDLIEILFLGYTVWVPTILASLIWIILHRSQNLKPISFWCGLLGGIIVWYVFEYVFRNSVPPTLAGLIVNYITISILQKNKL